MVPGFDGCGMIPVLPESAFPSLAAIEFPGDTPGRQVDRSCGRSCFTGILGQRMDVVGGVGEIEVANAVSFPGLEESYSPSRRSLANLRRNLR
jgi:hypothetical protein